MAQFQVNMAFSADTGKAKAQIAELQSLLSKIAYTGSTTNVADSLQKDLQEASTAAKELQFHLNNAFNVSTGKFDLSMLDKSLKTSGSNITDLSTKLLGAGATGQQAFATLAQSISLADQPMLRISKRMQDFAVTMKNTVKWQLSSSMLHGFMGAIQSAYGYAQDLNKSLTDIRIVTGASTDEMARFAEQANKAAKSLSTTTTDYTQASLIYFQQGLSDEEVAARTDVTIKMANAAGVSAQIASDQLTAVWNNFYDGSKSLEYYADVMTKLGAETASSTDEISEGLSKFAAVADTVGLSYEYATAALATVTSETRESADIVGNSFKTIFSRLQGVSLGETLDDGVNLNKYSEALAKVGVNIIGQNGELKQMDTILEELGAKWETLNKSQQTALAQTVGGAQQYARFISLMDNWDKVQENLDIAYSSEGALQEQADIYAQSWEAAQKRVQAAAEGIYQSLLDDEFFITINNGFANLLGGLDAFIEGAGGVKTVLTGIVSVIITSFANKIPDALDNVKYNLKVLTKGTEQAYKDIQTQMDEATKQAFTGILKDGTQIEPIKQDSALGYQITAANDLTVARSKLALVSDKMSASEQQMANTQLAIIEQAQKEVVAMKEKNDALKETISLQQQQIQVADIGQSISNRTTTALLDDTAFEFRSKRDTYASEEDSSYRAESYQNALDEMHNFVAQFDVIREKIADGYRNLDKIMYESVQNKRADSMLLNLSDYLPTDEINKMIESVQKLRANIDTTDGISLSDGFSAMKDEITAVSTLIPPAVQEVTGLKQIFEAIASDTRTNTLDQFDKQLNKLVTKFKEGKINGKDFAKILGSKEFHGKVFVDMTSNMAKLDQEEEKVVQKTSKLKQLLNEFNPSHVVRMSEAFGSLAGLMGNVITIGNSLKSMLESLDNPDLSGWEKFSAVLSGMSMIIPSVLSSLSNFATISSYWDKIAVSIKSSKNELVANNIALAANTQQQKLNEAASLAKLKVNGHQVTTYAQLNTAEIQAAMAAYANKEATEEETKAKIANIIAQGAEVNGSTTAAAAKIFETFATEGLTKGIWKLVAAKLGLNAAMLPYIAIVAGIAAVVGIAVAAYDALTISEEEAAKAAKEAQQNFEDTKEAYNSLISDIASIDDAQKSLSEMTKGTDEWRQAVMELNAQIMALINLYPQLAGAVKSVDGVLTIDKTSEAYKTFLENQQSQVYASQRASYGASKLASDKKIDTLYTDAYKDISQGYSWKNSTLTKSDLQVVVDAVRNQKIDLYDRDNLGSQLKELGISGYMAVNAIYSAKDDINNLAIAVESNTAASELYNEMIASSYLYNNEDYQNSEYKDEINKAVAAGLENEETDEWATNYEGKTDSEIQKLYAEEMGYQWVKDNFGGKGTYLDASGKEIKVDDSTARYYLNQQKWLEENTSGVTQEVTDVFNSLPEEMRGLIQSAIDGTKLTDEQLAIEGDAAEYLGEYANQLISIFGEDIIPIIQSAIDQTVQTQQDQFDLAGWKSDYQSKMDAVGEIDENNVLDAENYALLADEYSQYFDVQNDGSAVLKIKAEEFKSIVEGIELDKLKEEIASQKDIQDTALSNVKESTGGSIHSLTQLDDAVSMWQDSLNRGIDDTQADTRLQSNIGQGMMEALPDFDVDNYVSSTEALQALVDAWTTLRNDTNANQEAIASTATSLDGLRESFNEGTIDIEEYNNAIDATVAKEAEAEDLDYEAILDYAEYLSENAEALDDVDDALQGNLKDAKKVATVHAKLNKAVKKLSDNWEDWNKAIKSGDMDQMLEYLPDINDALKDMLDLTDENFEMLSDDFAVKNWDKIKNVVNGVEGALEDLQVAAAQDALINIKPEIENSEIFGEMTTLMDTLANMAEGTVLEFDTEVDNANALDSLGQLLADAGLTVEQMAALFDQLGWDPEITYKEMPFSEAQNYVGGGYQEILVPVDGGGWAKQAVSLAAENDISGETIVKVPVIKGTKTSGGSGSYTPQKTNSGGGGGGSAPKHAEKKSTSDKERYHTLTNQLEDLTSEYDKIAEASDRAFGKEKIKNIDKEIKATDDLIAKQEEYIDAISKDLPVDKSVMTAYYDDVIGGPAMEFDENGNISNYDDIQDAMFEKYNQMAETYDEDSTEWQAFEKQYEQLEKYIEQYEETYDLLREEEAALQDLINQRLDLQLEQVEYSVELKLDIAEDDLKLIEYQFDLLEDKAFASAERIAVSTEQANNLYDQILINRKGLEDTLGLSLTPAELEQVMSGDMSALNNPNLVFTESQMDAIREYKDSLIDLNQQLIEVQKQIEEEVLNTFDEWHEKLDEGIEQFDHYGDILENYKNIVDIVGKDVLGVSNETMAKLSQTQIDNSLNQLRSMREAYESYQKSADEAAEKMKAAQDKATMHREAEEAARAAGDKEEAEKQAQLAESYEEDAAFWEETYTEMNTAAQDAQQEMMDGWTNTLESIVEQFELAVERAVEAFNDAIYGLGGLEGLSNEFERQQEMADMYLKDYEQIYELSKLSRDINNTIDDTKSLAGKQKLKALLEEINEIQAEGVEMSEYDLEYLQAEYDLRLAEIALEEAQRAKDTVRLSKDNEGNWSYVYTQNTDAVDEAQQKYEDALYSMQDLSSNYIDEMSAKLIETSQEMQEALANVRVEDFASQEEYYAELQRIEEQYREQMAKEEAELNKAIGNNKVLYDTDWANYSAATGYKISETDKFVTSFKDSMLGLLTESDTDTSNFTNIIGEATTALVAGLGEAATTYYSNIDAAMQAAGTSTGDFAELLAEDIEAIKTESAEAADAVADMATKMDESMTAITDRVDRFQQDYGRNIDLIIDKNEEMVRTFNEMLETLSVDPDKINVTYDISKSQDGEGGETVEVPEGTATGYTGMYTGEWGSEGKVAVLHEKELLLNQGDTENFLKALEFTKQMMSVIDFQIQQASMGLGMLNAATVQDKYQEVLEQQVSIQAEFPNVQDHNEIEEAMRNLINTASQYANRK